MNPAIQSGMHPDAESLTAFAEQLLPEAEREQVLAHMATCSRCREVVFLAQRAASEESATPAVATVSPAMPRSSRFSGWRLAWVPIAALAGFIGIAVIQHFRHPEPEPRMTAKLSQTDALSKAESAKRAPASNQPATLPKAELQKAKPAGPPGARDGSLRLANKDEVKQLDQKKSVEEKELSVASPMVPSPGVSNGSLHGVITGAKASPYSGPMAASQYQQNQFQQNLDQQNLARQNPAQQKSQSLAADTANNLVTPTPAPASAAQTVIVQSESAQLAPTAAPASPPPQVSPIPLNGRNQVALSAVSTQQSDAQKITLPNGLGVLSVASEGGRSVALDTDGGMFLSEDNGKHWQSIQTQWTGRAMLVRTRPAGKQNGVLRAPQTIRFELVNDKLQTWVSYDGKTWTLQPLPLK